MMVMLVAGIGLILAGLLAIGYGIQYKEFSVGSTLILSGVVGACSGMLMIGLWVAVRELTDHCAAARRRSDGGMPAAAIVRSPPVRASPPAMAAFCSAAIRRSGAQPPQPRLARHRNLRRAAMA